MTTLHTPYRGNPDAVRALVRPDQVHRDLYISEELFALEQEHFFANTWNYVGHDSQLPNAGDYIRAEIAGQPLMAVRQSDKSVRVMMNRCAHKGSRLVTAPFGNTGKFFRCPYHAWTYKTDGSLLSIPLKNGYEGTQLSECEASKGLTQVKHVRLYRGFIFVKLNDAGPDFDEYFGDSLSSIDNMADRSPEGELEIAGGCLRFMHQCNWKMFIENLNDTMHPMVAHESSAGTAKSDVGRTSRPTHRSRWRSSSSCRSCRTTSSSRTWACACSTTATASRACTTASTASTRRSPSTTRR